MEDLKFKVGYTYWVVDYKLSAFKIKVTEVTEFTIAFDNLDTGKSERHPLSVMRQEIKHLEEQCPDAAMPKEINVDDIDILQFSVRDLAYFGSYAVRENVTGGILLADIRNWLNSR